jgi:hypothetical protein
MTTETTETTACPVYAQMASLYAATAAAEAAHAAICARAHDQARAPISRPGPWWLWPEVAASQEVARAAYAAEREYSQRHYGWG